MDLIFISDNPIRDLLALANLAVFLGLGIYGLRQRLRYRVQWRLGTQAAVLIYVLLTCALETEEIRIAMGETPEFLIFSTLGILAAAVALYGHIAFSFVLHLMIDFWAPGSDKASDRPRFGPAETREHLEDYRGALDEYALLERMYPNRPDVFARIAACHFALGDHERATSFYIKALNASKSAEEGASLLWRLTDLLAHKLNRPEEAAVYCDEFLRRFPNSEEAVRAATRGDACRASSQRTVTDKASTNRPGLERLDQNPINHPGSTPT